MSNTYKDSLFRSLFGEKREFLRLYNAISGSNYDDDTEVTINTLTDTFFTNQKNDVSGLIKNTLVVLTEHQSTINENMPFRFLPPIVRLFENGISDKKLIYRQKLVKLPRPEFFVLYNGTAPCPGRMTLKLSDAFENIEGVNSVNLELLVTVLNMNKGHNEGIVKRSETLSGYVDFVDLVRHRQKQIMRGGVESNDALKKSIIYAMNYCKEHHILEWFFNNLTMEEENMLATEWNFEEALEVRAEEAWEDGIEQDREWIMGLIEQAKTVDELKRMIETAPPLTRKTDKTITNGQ